MSTRLTGPEILQGLVDELAARGVRDFISGATFDAIAFQMDLMRKAERARCSAIILAMTAAPPQHNSKDKWVEQIGSRLLAKVNDEDMP